MTQPANESNAKRPGEFIPHRGEINGEEAPNPVFRSSRSGSNDRSGEPDWDRLALDERIDRGPGRPIQVHDFVAPLPPDAEPWPWYGTNDTEDLLPTVSPDRPTIALAYALAGIMVFLAGCAFVYFISP